MKIIVISSNSNLTKGIILTLLKHKIQFSIIGTENVLYSVSSLKLCDSYYKIKESDFINNPDYIVEIIENELINNEKNFIIPGCIQSTLFVSQYGKEIQGNKNFFPISDIDTLNMLKNKWSFYQFLKENNILTPETFLIDRSTQYISNTFPIMTKPLNLANGRNVIKSENQEDLSKVICSYENLLLIQEFIDGIDLNLGLLCLDGKILSWVIHRNDEKEGIIFLEDKQILEIGEKITRILRFNGIIHFDLRIDLNDQTIKVIECNPRVWGSMIYAVYGGVNFIESMIFDANAENNMRTISNISALTKKSLFRKIKELSITNKDIKILVVQFKYFLYSPIYYFKLMNKRSL